MIVLTDDFEYKNIQNQTISMSRQVILDTESIVEIFSDKAIYLTLSKLNYNLFERKSDMELKKKIDRSGYKYYNFLESTVNFLIALCALVIGSPLLLIIACCIKLEDPKGKIFFKQKRVGIHGKTFDIYKFRSMYTNAEKIQKNLQAENEMDGQMFKMKKDPRVTKIGKTLRKLSLDELPQFLNILKGDMNLIGPRPPLVSEYKNYSSYSKGRLSVKPGCTGLWQISGRNQLTFDEMIELDLYYIKNRSLKLDLSIILLTFKEFTYKGSGY